MGARIRVVREKSRRKDGSEREREVWGRVGVREGSRRKGRSARER